MFTAAISALLRMANESSRKRKKEKYQHYVISVQHLPDFLPRLISASKRTLSPAALFHSHFSVCWVLRASTPPLIAATTVRSWGNFQTLTLL